MPLRRSALLVPALLLPAALPVAALPAPAQASPATAATATPVASSGYAGRAARSAALDLPLGHDRIGVRRSDTWYLRADLGGGAAEVVRQHVGGWAPVAADLEGDGSSSLGLFRNGEWRLADATGRPTTPFRFGLTGDLPVVGDWDGDGVDTVGVYRGGRFYLRDAPGGGPARVVGFGVPGDVPVVGDWDGDGRTDLGVKRGDTWYQRDASTPGPASRSFRFGLSGDRPVVGDWEHDGKDTVAAFRDGTWFLRDASGRYQQVRFGLRGDAPVVRRVVGLAPGVSHRVVRDPAGFFAHVVSVQLDAASTPDVVLGQGRLTGTELTSSIGRRSGAVAAVNGDFYDGAGRPVHALALDGRLARTSGLADKALGLDLVGTTVTMGRPAVSVSVQPEGRDPLPLAAWNDGQPDGDEVVGFTALGAPDQTPRGGACYAGLEEGTTLLRDGVVETTTRVTGRRCFGDPAMVPTTGSLLTANTFAAQQPVFEALVPGQGVVQRATLGFPGAVDLVGGNPLLVVDGSVPSADVDVPGSFAGPNPRTAVGVTADGVLLLVVVDGRQPGYSSGASLRQLADLMVALGARYALNLDGGGSSTMWLNGVVANRPSDGVERGASSALVVLPAGDPGQAGLQVAPPPGILGRRTAEPEVTRPVPAAVVEGPADSAARAQRDPASTGGLDR